MRYESLLTSISKIALKSTPNACWMRRRVSGEAERLPVRSMEMYPDVSPARSASLFWDMFSCSNRP